MGWCSRRSEFVSSRSSSWYLIFLFFINENRDWIKCFSCMTHLWLLYNCNHNIVTNMHILWKEFNRKILTVAVGSAKKRILRDHRHVVKHSSFLFACAVSWATFIYLWLESSNSSSFLKKLILFLAHKQKKITNNKDVHGVLQISDAGFTNKSLWLVTPCTRLMELCQTYL